MSRRRCPVVRRVDATRLHREKPLVLPIEFTMDRERRVASINVPGIAQSSTEPIKNPVTGEEHRARIVLPHGFEYKEAEMGNSVYFRVTSKGALNMAHENTYAQLNAFDWSNA